MKVKVTVDKIKQSCKPKKKDIWAISNRIACKDNIIDLEISKLATGLVLPYGFTWTPTIFKGNERKNEEWASQQLFALDFDNGITLKEVIERCSRYNVKPSFAYSTFSSENNDKFRVIFVNDHIVDDYRVRTLIQLALMNLFPESDKACKDASRMYYGGKEIIYNDYEAIINTLELVEGLVFYFSDKDKAHFSRNIKQFCTKTGVDMINGYPKIIKNEKVEIGESNTPSIRSNSKSTGLTKNHYTIYFNEKNIKESSIKVKKSKYPVSNEIVKRDKLIRKFNYDKRNGT